MDAGGVEKDCSALDGLFQTIMTDMKGSYPVWEDFISKTTKLQSHLRTTVVITGAFLDAFQKVADLATNTRGATREIGSTLTRMCLRHRSIESRLKQLTAALTDSLINPLELRIEEWKKIAAQLDKDHTKEYKKARQEIKKKSGDTLKLQKKVKKGRGDARVPLQAALQDVNDKYVQLEEAERRAVERALLEERRRFCTFVSLMRPVLNEEMGMLGELTHLQTTLEDLGSLTADPHTLPPASQQVILDLKATDDYYSYHTPPSSPTGTLSRRGTSSSYSLYLPAVARHPSIPSFEPVSPGAMLPPPPPPDVSVSDDSQDWPALPPPDWAPSAGYNGTTGPAGTERPQALTATAYKVAAGGPLPLSLPLAGAGGEGRRGSRDSLPCSSGYSTQTTTPSCSEDTIPMHPARKDQALIVSDYDYLSLPGEPELLDQLSFDKSSTIPRNSDLSHNYRRMFQGKRPASTVSLCSDPAPPHLATIRRKPSSKPGPRRGTISGVPIPIRTPVVPMLAPVPGPMGGRATSDECVRGGHVHRDLRYCASTQPGPGAHQPGPGPHPPGPGAHQPGSAGNGLSVPPAKAEGSQRPATTSPTDPGDVLSVIRGGVKLRKTITNDRSAPQLM